MNSYITTEEMINYLANNCLNKSYSLESLQKLARVELEAVYNKIIEQEQYAKSLTNSIITFAPNQYSIEELNTYNVATLENLLFEVMKAIKSSNSSNITTDDDNPTDSL